MIAFFYDSYHLVLFFLIPGILTGMVYDIFRVLRVGRSEKIAVPHGLLKKIHPPKLFRATHPLFSKIKNTLRIADGALIFIEDVIFWMIAGLLEFLFIFHTNGGEIRIYCLIATCIGFFAYRMSVGRLVLLFSRHIFYFGRCLFGWLLFPVIRLVEKLILGIAFLEKKTIGKFVSSVSRKRAEKISKNLENMILESALCGFAEGCQNEERDEFFC